MVPERYHPGSNPTQTARGSEPLGRVTVPASANLLTIILDNQDATTQRWDTGAGDLAFHCIRQAG